MYELYILLLSGKRIETRLKNVLKIFRLDKNCLLNHVFKAQENVSISTPLSQIVWFVQISKVKMCFNTYILT